MAEVWSLVQFERWAAENYPNIFPQIQEELRKYWREGFVCFSKRFHPVEFVEGLEVYQKSVQERLEQSSIAMEASFRSGERGRG